MNRRDFILGAMTGAAALAVGGLGAAVAQGIDPRDLARISNYLNGTTTLMGEFVQVGPDGDLSTGTFWMRRPGRMRFEYDLPNPALIIADGTWVGIYDRALNTLDRVPLGQTPLDILLRDRVDLRREGVVTEMERSDGQIRVKAIDPDAPDQGSITMIFSDNPLELRQWVVVDAQGLTTTIALSELRSNVSIDGDKFFIAEPKRN
ncbi:outer-membrane lipoprotein carrier protein LolA [Limibaculum sp. M0105]|uniref:Outer-membrane lipoprotein carrier protein LolA n=1 Tax=Thermohalobaculum xanthum TaxID=2753746 RepID=A0A8J7M7S1_9RHOB|nr:outer-membrane lipoprotein carrier protein LolA [Thermohalobaculum xanthum]MBK0399114.1 outer-membrane lipoprotein carrier protein LolA [Thermohalobaculum xanthum]